MAKEAVKDYTAEINGRVYNLWPQFVAQKGKWIGGQLQELQDSFPPVSEGKCCPTEITGIDFRPNGTDSAYFEVTGEDYTCGFDVAFGGVIPGEAGWITFSGFGNHQWRINPKDE